MYESCVYVHVCLSVYRFFPFAWFVCRQILTSLPRKSVRCRSAWQTRRRILELVHRKKSSRLHPGVERERERERVSEREKERKRKEQMACL